MSTLLGALALVGALAGCAPAGVADARCDVRAPEVGDPREPRTAPPGWPPVPDGDTVCGTASFIQGGYGTSSETLIAVTDDPMDVVFAHYTASLPPTFTARVWGFAADAELRGDDGHRTTFAVAAAGEGRYAITFQVLSRPLGSAQGARAEVARST